MFDITGITTPISIFATAKNATVVNSLILKPGDFDSNTVRGIMRELEQWPDVMNFIRGRNLRGGDFLELVASELASDNNADLNKLANGMK